MFPKRGYSVLNIIGFAIALSFVFCIFGYISHETSYDRFFPEGGRYRVLMKSGEEHTIGVPLGLSRFLGDSFPEDIDRCTNVVGGTQTFTHNDVSTAIPVLLSDSSFFQVFDFGFIYGDPVSCLQGRDKLVITESVCRKFFGGQDPVGIYVVDRSGTKPRNIEITAVVKDPPPNCHLRFEGISSDINKDPVLPLEWDRYATRPQYIKLKGPGDIADLEKKMSAFYEQYGFPEHVKVVFENIESIHLNSKAIDDQFLVGNKTNVHLFWLILILLLFVAYTNHFNLFGTEVINRAKDYGVRKILGAGRYAIMRLIFCDALKFFLATVPIVLVLAYAVWPVFTGYLIVGGIPHAFLFSARNVALLLLSVLLGGTVTAFVIGVPISRQSAKNLVRDMKIDLSLNRFFKSSLLVLQFVFTSLLITGSIVFVLQLRLINRSDLGFDQADLVVLRIQRYDRAVGFLDNLRNHRNVQHLSVANFDLGDHYAWIIEPEEGQDAEADPVRLAVIDGDLDFCRTIGAKLEAGRFFSGDRGLDLVDHDSVRTLNKNGIKTDKLSVPIIISNSARQYLKKPAEPAVGQVLNIEDMVYGTVVGVIGEIKGLSLRNDPPPLLVRVKNKHNYYGYLYVRLENKNIGSALAHIENEWNKAFPGVPFSYSFAKDRMEKLYDEDARIAKLLVLMAAITASLSCAGLFGLLSFDIRKRFREIGIRKILGVPNYGIMLAMSRHYVVIILFAILASAPISLMLVKRWLDSFTLQIGTGMLIFTCAVSALLLLFLISLTLYAQMVRAIAMKPVLSLRKDN